MWDTHSQTYRLTHTNHKLVYAPAYHSNCNLCLSSSRSFLHSSSEFTYPSYHQNISSILDQYWKVDTRLFHQIWPCPGLSATFLISYTHFPESQLDCGSSKLKLLFCKDGKKYNLHMKAKASINAQNPLQSMTITLLEQLSQNILPLDRHSKCLRIVGSCDLLHVLKGSGILWSITWTIITKYFEFLDTTHKLCRRGWSKL